MTKENETKPQRKGLKEFLLERKQPSTSVDVELFEGLTLEIQRPTQQKLWSIQNKAMREVADVDTKSEAKKYFVGLGLATQEMFLPLIKEHLIGWTYEGINDDDVYEFTPENANELFAALKASEMSKLVSSYLDALNADMRQAEGNEATSDEDLKTD